MLKIGEQTVALAQKYCAKPLVTEVFDEIKGRRDNFLRDFRRILATIPRIDEKADFDVNNRDLYILARSLQYWADGLTEDSKIKWAIQIAAEDAMRMLNENLKFYWRQSP